MKILVVSDSHGDARRLQKIIDHENPFDAVIHCGDGVKDLDRCTIPDGVVRIKVSGNVDRSSYPEEDEIRVAALGGMMILAVHGERFGIKEDYSELKSYASTRGIDIVFFGHTHIKKIVNGYPVLFNPGPVNRGCYGTVFIDESAIFEHKNI